MTVTQSAPPAEETVTPKIRRVKVDPELAEKWLEHNHSNRYPKKTAISKFARDMAAGNWLDIFTPILRSRPDQYGNVQLLDGQNRLYAVIEAGVTVEFTVVEDLDPRVQAVVDSGNSRRLGDSLTMNGVRLGNTVAATGRLLWSIRQGPEALLSTRLTPTNQELMEVIESTPGIQAAVYAVSGSYKRIRLAPSNAAIVYYLGSLKYPESTRDFFDALLAGTGEDGQPVVALRNRLLQHTNKPLNRWQQLYLTLRALIAARNGTRLDRLVLPTGFKVTGEDVLDLVEELTS